MAYDKYNYENATSAEIKSIEKTARLPDYDNKKSHTSKSIGTIYITGGGFIKRPFTGAGVDSKYGWEELVWYKQPTRAKNFAFSNLDDIDVGLVARCELNLKYMNYQDYMDFRKIVAREKHFTVEFFNVDTNEWITRDMYCSENTTSKLFNLKQSMIGVLDYTIKLVGTNLDLYDRYTGHTSGSGSDMVVQFTVSYNANGGTGSISSVTKTWGSSIFTDLGDSLSPPTSGKYLKYWVTKDGNNNINGYYGLGQSVTVWKDMTFYAVWEDVSNG